MSGASWVAWALVHRNQTRGQLSAMKRRFEPGSAAHGQLQKIVRREGRQIVFVDESGISEQPTRVRTWAPKGQTPVIQVHFSWNHVSAIAGLTRTNSLLRLHEGSIKKDEIVEFLKALKAHRTRFVREYLDG
jgi:hypothetical protein